MTPNIEYNIVGETTQVVEIALRKNQLVRAEPGAMLYMEEGIEMLIGSGAGVLSGFKRMVTGDAFFITSFINKSAHEKKHLALSAPYSGKIMMIDLKLFGGTILCQKDSFLCSASSVEIKMEWTRKIGSGFFGGEGFVLQRLSGEGFVFLQAGGTLLERDLKEGETLQIDTGSLVAMQPTIKFEVQFVGGFKNILFGGEGLFLTKLTGPGKLFLQSVPFSRMVDRITMASLSSKNKK